MTNQFTIIWKRLLPDSYWVRCLMLALGLLAWASIDRAKAQIALLDTGGITIVSRGSGTTAFSVPATVSEGAKVLVVCLNDRNVQNGSPASLTWQGQTLTRAVMINNTAGTWRDSAIYYVFNPTPGSGNITGTFTGTIGDYWTSVYTLVGVDTTVPPLTGSVNSGGANTIFFTINNVPQGAWAATAATYANSGGYSAFNLALSVNGTPSGTITQNAMNGANNTPNMAAYASGLTAGNTLFSATEVGTTLNQKMSFVGAVFTPIASYPPTGIIATGGTNQITLSWTAPTSVATNYVVYRSTTSGGPYTYVDDWSASPYVDAPLDSGITYYYVIRSQGPLGESVNSAQASAITAPNAPATLVALAGDTRVTLSWPASIGAASYVISRSTTSGVTYVPIATNSATSFIDNTVANLTTYYYVVSARNAAGDSPTTSPEASAKPDVAPLGVTATASSGQIALAWDALSGASSYNVKRSPQSSGPYTTMASGLTSPSYVDSSLGDGFTFFYVISAQLGTGESANSAEVSATTPFLPITLTATGVSTVEIDLSWIGAGAGVTLYKVERSTDGVNFTQIGTATGLAYADTGLLLSRKYYYRVRAFNGNVDSPYSAIAQGNTYSLSIGVNFGAGTLGQGGVMGDYPGYLRDIGEVYALRDNGYTYGWDVDNQANARTRATASPDLRYQTLNHLQKQTPSRVWSMALPDGRYTVHVVGGDPDNYNSIFQYLINGVNTAWLDTTPGSFGHWAEFTNHNIAVTNGILSVNSGPNATNNKICYIDIYAPSAPPTFVVQPQDMTVMEDFGPTNFSASAVGSLPLSYQWYFNDALLTGQTNRTLVFNPVRMPNQGFYYMVVTNNFGAVTSRVTSLTVTPDTVLPYVVSVSQDLTVGNANRILIVFSEQVLPSTATNIGQYFVSPDSVAPINATLLGDGRTVALWCDAALTPATTFSVRVNGVQDLAVVPNTMLQSTTPFTTWSTIYMMSARYLYYTNITGNAVSNLLTDPKFVNNLPDTLGYLSSLDWPPGSAITDIGNHTNTTAEPFTNNYGLRMSGYIIPSVTTNYIFHLLSDDEGRFLLSSDENPTNLQTIVRYGDGACCGAGLDSAPIYLTAGRAYYMEAYQKQGAGGDGLHVSWKFNNSSGAFAAISSANLAFAWRPDLLVQIQQQPVSQNLVEGQIANFSVRVFSTELGLSYQWQQNGVDIPGATSPTYTPRVDGSMNGATIHCTISSRLETDGLAGSVPIVVTSQDATLTVLGTPTNVVVAGAATTMTLTWDPVAMATNYVVSRGTSPTGPFEDVMVTTDTTFLQSGLSAGTVYYWRVASQGALGQSAYCNPVVGYTIPPIPTGLVAVPGDTQITLNWTPTRGALFYYVYRSATLSGSFAYIGLTNNPVFLDTGLVNGTPWFYKVSAGNDAGFSAKSAAAKGTPASAPTGLVATGGTNAISLVWSEMTGATSYNVKRAVSSGGPYTTIASGVIGLSYLDTASLASGTRYYYIVSAQVSGVESGNSLEAGAFTAPSAPTTLTITVTNYTTATMTWTFNDPVPATSFIIEQSREGADYTVSGTVAGTERTFTATGLDQNKAYVFRVRAVNDTGFSPYSDTAAWKGPYFTLSVNFGAGPLGQGGVMPDYPGYLRDIGEIYGLRTNGFTYGWDADNQTNARYRLNIISPDLRYDTFNHMQKTTPARYWEIAVPPGDYRVVIVSGDANNVDSTFQYNVENSITEALVPTTNAHWVTMTNGGNVSDGRLTIACGPSALNNKICFIDILPPEAPAIVTDPQSLTVNEGYPATFTVVASGAPVFYQWYFNDTLLPGQTATTLTIPFVNCTHAGNYYVVASNTFASVTSGVAVLTVPIDNMAPSIVSIGSLDGQSIGVVFSEPIRLDTQEFTDPSTRQFNWQIFDTNILANQFVGGDPGMPTYLDFPVIGIKPWPDTNAVFTDKIILELAYVTDFTSFGVPGWTMPYLHGQFNLLAGVFTDTSCAANMGGGPADSMVIGLTPLDIGVPSPAGAHFSGTSNRVDVVAGGADIWNNYDQFTYLYRPIDGDFDARVTVLGIPNPPGPVPNGWAKAGLMARAYVTDTPLYNASNSPMAYIVTTPTNVGAQHTFASGIRYDHAGATYDFPLNAERTGINFTNNRPWLYEYPAQIRMVRQGSTISTYSWSYVTNAWTDPGSGISTTNVSGPRWVLNGVADTTNWPSAIYIGLATTSHQQGSGASASYEDFKIMDHIYVAPSITAPPVDQVGTCGDPATFTVAAAGDGPLTYQWYLNGIPLEGATANTLTVPNFSAANSGPYTVEISSEYGTVTSAPVFIRDIETPTIVALPNLGPFECPALVEFTAVATDSCGPVAVVCLPPSGSAFPVGVTTVNCTATDAATNTATTSFTVTVVDTSIPVITGCPGNQTATTTSNSAVVAWAAPTASDACAIAGPVTCTPASGSDFPLGTTPVDCVATDLGGNSAHCTFNVVVSTACGARPTLHHAYNGTTLTLTWTKSPCYGLFVRPDLGQIGEHFNDLVWTPYGGTITDDGTTCTAVIEMPTTGFQFYVLK